MHTLVEHLDAESRLGMAKPESYVVERAEVELQEEGVLFVQLLDAENRRGTVSLESVAAKLVEVVEEVLSAQLQDAENRHGMVGLESVVAELVGVAMVHHVLLALHRVVESPVGIVSLESTAVKNAETKTM